MDCYAEARVSAPAVKPAAHVRGQGYALKGLAQNHLARLERYGVCAHFLEHVLVLRCGQIDFLHLLPEAPELVAESEVDRACAYLVRRRRGVDAYGPIPQAFAYVA